MLCRRGWDLNPCPRPFFPIFPLPGTLCVRMRPPRRNRVLFSYSLVRPYPIQFLSLYTNQTRAFLTTSCLGSIPPPVHASPPLSCTRTPPPVQASPSTSCMGLNFYFNFNIFHPSSCSFLQQSPPSPSLLSSCHHLARINTP
jgi:hypothetical protein